MKTLAGDGSSVDTGTPAERNAAPLRRASGASEEDAGAASGGGAALDIPQIMPPPQVKAHISRRERWRRRQESARLLVPLASETPEGAINPVRVAKCSWTIGQTVGIMHDGGERPAGYAGIERCSSIWACPSCSAVIRAGRAAEIEEAVTKHQKTGGELLFFTGTLRHHNGDKLSLTLDAVLEAWRKLTAGRPWKNRKIEHAISGYIRSIEVTHGENGWHPHAHVLLFLDEPMGDGALEDFRAWLFEKWAGYVAAAGGNVPTEKGLDLQRVDKKGKVLAKYLSKIQDEKKPEKRWGVGAEMSRSDVKRGRVSTTITPFQLLDELDGMHERERGRLWREFYQATKGRRAITWARGLKARYEIGEKTDDDLLEEAENTVVVWTTTAKNYRRVHRVQAERLAYALELAEAEDWARLAEILPCDESWVGDVRQKSV